MIGHGQPGNADVSVEFDVPATMRDGVTLFANVYRPINSTGRHDVLLSRLPYSKDDPRELTWLEPIRAARRGFIVVLQDTRGRFASAGEWSPFTHEANDGYDTVEWAARLDGASGRVGMFGTSYLGNTQWQAALQRPPSLGAIAPALTWAEPLDGLISRGGALELGLGLPWALTTGLGHLSKAADQQTKQELIGSGLDDLDGLLTDGYWALPAIRPPLLDKYQVPDIGTFSAINDPQAVAPARVTGRYADVSVPVLNIGGWYDIFLQGTLDNYTALRSLGLPARLLVGPWLHDLARLSDPFGELCFGARASAIGVQAHPEGDLHDLQLSWFENVLAGDYKWHEEQSRVRIFVMGLNAWRDEQDWPLSRARAEDWQLAGDGTLRRLPDPQGPTSYHEFLYDPADPVPSIGGQSCGIPGLPPGPFEQGRIEGRQDVLTFTSDPLEHEIEVTGRVGAVLYVESSAVTTDWVVRLCDVFPDGLSFNLCDGIRRVVHRPNEIEQIEIDLWSTSNLFRAGHRIRVHITSSCFPRWDRNLNTGSQGEPRMVVARQRIYSGVGRESIVQLPVVSHD